MVMKSNKGQFVSVAVWASALAAIMFASSGCSLTGIRKVDLWGAKFEMAEGQDFHIGANQIDHVDDRRGVSRLPAASQSNKPY